MTGRAVAAVFVLWGAALASAAPLAGEEFGRSVRGRDLRVVRIGDPGAPVRILVVGSVHGNEPAGIAVTRALRHAEPPEGTQILVVDDLNPDGRRARSRGNARGVDLNRNLPWGWRRMSGLYASGPRPSSEPETRAAQRLILRERPAVTIWYHQSMDLVDANSGADRAVVRRYARAARMRVRTLAPLPGTWTRWENHRLPGTSAFVVELPAGRLSASAIRRHVGAVVAVASLVG